MTNCQFMELIIKFINYESKWKNDFLENRHYEFSRKLPFIFISKIWGHSGSHQSKKIRISHRAATRTTFAYSLTLRPAHLAPAATRTRSNSHPTAARTFFMMDALKKYTSRTTAAARTLFLNVTTRASRTRSNSHPAAAVYVSNTPLVNADFFTYGSKPDFWLFRSLKSSKI